MKKQNVEVNYIPAGTKYMLCQSKNMSLLDWALSKPLTRRETLCSTKWLTSAKQYLISPHSQTDIRNISRPHFRRFTLQNSNSVLSARVEKHGLGLVGGGKQVYCTKELGCAECHITSVSRSRYNTQRSI